MHTHTHTHTQSSRGDTPQKKKKGGKKKQQFSQEELDAPVTISLSETPTVELFHLKGYRVFLDSDLHRAVTKRNERYNALFEKHENVVRLATVNCCVSHLYRRVDEYEEWC